MKTTRTVLAAAALFALSSVATSPIIRADDAAPASQPSAPVDYHKLKEQLPETLAGVKRTSLEGSRMKFGEMSVSNAKADYGGEEGKLSFHIEAVSYNNAEVAKGMAAWTQMEIDNESDDGFQKSVKIQDQPAMLDYKTKEKTGTITVLAGNVMLTVNVENASPEDFKKVQDALPAKAIAALK